MKYTFHKRGSNQAFDLVNGAYGAIENALSDYEKGPHSKRVAKAIRKFLKGHATRKQVARKIRDEYLAKLPFGKRNVPVALLPVVQALLDTDPRGFLDSATEQRGRVRNHLAARALEVLELTETEETLKRMTDIDLQARGLMHFVEDLAGNIGGDEFFDMLHTSPVCLFKKALVHLKDSQLSDKQADYFARLKHNQVHDQVRDYRRMARVMQCVEEALRHGRVTKDNIHIWMHAICMHYFDGVPKAHVAVYVQEKLEELGGAHPTRKDWESVTYRAFNSLVRYMKKHFDLQEWLGSNEADEGDGGAGHDTEPEAAHSTGHGSHEVQDGSHDMHVEDDASANRGQHGEHGNA